MSEPGLTRAPQGSQQEIQPTVAFEAVVDEARTVLMEWFEVQPRRADELLLAWASEYGVPVYTVACTLVDAICHGSETGANPVLLRRLEADLRQLPDLR